MRYLGISGVVNPTTLRIARNDQITLVFTTLEGEEVQFSPLEGEEDYLKWKGTVNGKAAILQISLCADCSSIQIKG